MEQVPHDANRLRHIDALRAAAATLVLWRHVADVYVNLGPGVSGRWLQSVAAAVDFGRIGVVAFFMISGFVIPFSINPKSPAPVGTFLTNPIKVQVGGAIAFVLDVERFERF